MQIINWLPGRGNSACAVVVSVGEGWGVIVAGVVGVVVAGRDKVACMLVSGVRLGVGLKVGGMVGTIVRV